MGDVADDIFASLSLTAEEQKVCKTVRDKLEAHFVKKQNITSEHLTSSTRRQECRQFHNRSSLSCITLQLWNLPQ